MRVILLSAILVTVFIPPAVTAAAPAPATGLAHCKDSGQTAEARIAACTSVIESGLVTGADLAQIYALRGNVRFAAHDYALAIQDYDRAIALKPGWGTLTLRGMAHAKMGAYDAAVSDCSRALQMVPELAMARECVDEAQKSKTQLTAGSKP